MGRDYDRIELFVPEGNRRSKSIPVDLHDRWVIRLLRFCTREFGGATALGRGVGAWMGGSAIQWDRVTVIEAWLDPARSRDSGAYARLGVALLQMGVALRQEAVACIIRGRLRIFRCEVSP